jgi:hypothetical protein
MTASASATVKARSTVKIRALTTMASGWEASGRAIVQVRLIVTASSGSLLR